MALTLQGVETYPQIHAHCSINVVLVFRPTTLPEDIFVNNSRINAAPHRTSWILEQFPQGDPKIRRNSPSRLPCEQVGTSSPYSEFFRKFHSYRPASYPHLSKAYPRLIHMISSSLEMTTPQDRETLGRCSQTTLASRNGIPAIRAA